MALQASFSKTNWFPIREVMLSENYNTVKADSDFGFSTQAFKMIDCLIKKQ